MDAQGTAQLGNKSYATSISLDCVVDDNDEVLDCVGIMTLGSAQADIVMDVHGDTQEARWALEAGAPSMFKPVHDLWADEIVPEACGLPFNWQAVDYYAGGGWTYWYFSTTWAETFQAITGMPYPYNPWS
ncbi:hypothetical protein DB30_00705 [Enhygromyxa salina]|uniref:Uncharacterized protein n=1 Tax=Enhygromyxa salina TaxID=215803 RepID=A0A0C2DA46_9BACT|nr:hypothetical protein DB30_00705 [Enhygromyxa salina]